eukprot:7148903-Prymnesium_polylepis.1
MTSWRRSPKRASRPSNSRAGRRWRSSATPRASASSRARRPSPSYPTRLPPASRAPRPRTHTRIHTFAAQAL